MRSRAIHLSSSEAKRRAILLCPGPSFEPDMIPLYHKCGDVYTVNRAIRPYLHYSFREKVPLVPEGAFFIDASHHFKEEKKIIKDDRLRKIIRHTHVYNYMRKRGRGTRYRGNVLSYDFQAHTLEGGTPFVKGKDVSPILTTISSWIWLITKGGYKEILIAGCDCDIKEKTYFCDYDDPMNEIERKRKRYTEVFSYLKAWLPLAEDLGVQTKNLTEGSRLKEIMPTISIEEVWKCERLNRR